MITLNQIRELIIKQDKELEEIILSYFSQKGFRINNSLNEDSIHLDLYKEQTKSEIEALINQNKLHDAKQLLKEYKLRIKEDVSIYSISGIISLQENKLEEALDFFIKGLEFDSTNVDLLYNMGYLNVMLGNNEDAMYYYNKCLNETTDNVLIDEINNTINELTQNTPTNYFTFITIGLDKEDSIFEELKSSENKIINIVEDKECRCERKYEENGIVVCEVSTYNTHDMIESLIRRNKNCIILYSDINRINYIYKLREHVRLVYYPKKNYYIDKNDSLNHNINIFVEKEACNRCDIIITNNITIYNYKKIIERRDNVYFINKQIDRKCTIEYITKNFNNAVKFNIEDVLKQYSKTIEDEYEKSLYILASEYGSIQNSIEISKYIYDKYNTEEIYHIYLSLLNESKEYISLVATAINSEYCEDIYKCELLYLSSLEEYDLINFIVDISIKNYNSIDNMSKANLEYKLALYNFELNRFKVALDKYIEVLDYNSNLSKSAIVNRNVGYLMYASGNRDYEIYYDIYENLIGSLEEEKYDNIDIKDNSIYDELLECVEKYITKV